MPLPQRALRLPLPGAASIAAMALGVALVVASCTGAASPAPAVTPSSSGWASAPGSTPVVPVIASSGLARGRERFLFTLTDQASHLLAAADVAAHVRFFDLARSDSKPASEADAVFFWAIPGTTGLYHVPAIFGESGAWGAEFQVHRLATASPSPGTIPSPDPLASTVTIRVTFSVRDKSSTPAIGAPAPEAENATLATVGGDPANLWKISTDKNPEPRFYQVNISQAIAARRPFLVIFATPAFCETGMCGPTLDTVKQVVADYPTLTVIHVEPYQLAASDGAVQPVVDANGDFTPVAAATAWGLHSEPFTFLVGADGRIAASFEGPIDASELREAIGALPGS